MTPGLYSEDILVQSTTADYLEQQLGWQSVFAYNNEVFLSNPHPGPLPEGEGKVCLGRGSDREVVLTRTLRTKLVDLNPGLPDTAYDDAIRQITAVLASQTVAATNREKYDLIRDGVQVTFRNGKGERAKQRLRVIDFDNPAENDFRFVRELWVRGDLYRRRADIVGFVNGLPLLFIECKNIHKNLKAAFEQNFSDYRDTIPHLFHHNAIVMFGNGEQARIGSITSRWEHFNEWKRLAEEGPGVVDMETMLKGVCEKRNFLDLVENFILFDETAGEAKKIIARNHQFLGVNRAIAAVVKRYHSATLTQPLPGGEEQLPSPSGRGAGGEGRLGAITLRNDIIVITDEAHRTQYGTLALNLRNALPNASYIGFTGTPLFKDDEITRRVFGQYVSTYDFQRAVDDQATVPLYYDARGEKLGVAIGDLNERIAAKLEELETDNIDVEQRLEKELKRDCCFQHYFTGKFQNYFAVVMGLIPGLFSLSVIIR